MRPWLLSLDVTSVVVFVAVGRANHGEEASASGFVQTAAPFLIAVTLGWAIMRAWRAPGSIRVGIGVVTITVAAGMIMRRVVFGDGTATSFVLVATAFLTLFMLGWRIVVRFAANSAHHM